MPFICSSCGREGKVLDSRRYGADNKRRYVCTCGRRFTTIEVEVQSKGGGNGKRIFSMNDLIVKEAEIKMAEAIEILGKLKAF